MEIARRYLSAVVVIDDRAAFGSADDPGKEGSASAEPTGDDGSPDVAVLKEAAETEGAPETDPVHAPNQIGTVSDQGTRVPNGPVLPGDASASPSQTAPHTGLIAPEVDTHRLSASEVSEAFAREGLICTILRPPTTKAISELAVHAVHRADAIVLDWVLADGEPPGQTARTILSSLLAQAHQPFRLICIYTGDPAIETIAAELAAEFDGALAGDYEATIANLKLIVLAKEGNVAAAARQVDFSELAARVIREFASVATGLMPAFALASLGALREQSEPIMRRLHRLMDAGFLGHRMALRDPDDSSRHVIDSLADEINSILSADRLVGMSLGYENLLDHSRACRREDAQLIDCDQRFSHNMPGQLDNLLRDGGAKPAWATKVHAVTDEEAYRSDLWFAELLQTRSYYGPNPPYLTLGVVLRVLGTSKPEYCLCLQPVCDSVRMELGSSRPFPLLPLAVADKSPAKYVVDDGGTPVPLMAHIKLFEIVLLSFKCNNGASGTVTAEPLDDRWLFVDDGARQYVYVARLRDVTSQRAAFDLGVDAGRVGVDEPEWIRVARKATGPPSGS